MLPREIIKTIEDYIPRIVTIFLTKDNYLLNHKHVRQYINNKHIENFIRAMIRQDNYFVFKQLLVENSDRWLNLKKYYYKNCIYSNYIHFLDEYCIDNESTRCRKLIMELIEELGLSKNRHKKNVVQYIRWTH
jgi:hypothetical protein